MKNKKIIITIFIIVILIGVAVLNHKTGTDSKIASLLNEETKDQNKYPVKSELNKEIDGLCPYTSGSTYRQCLFDFSEKTYRDLDISYSDLIRDVKVVMEEDLQRNGEDNNNTPKEDFLKSVDAYNKKWKPYTESLCSLDASILWGGTGQGEIITLCEIKETRAYIAWLERFRDDWVNPMIKDDLDKKAIPKTDAYKILMNKYKSKI